MSKPSYAPGFLNLIEDPYAKAEFEKLIAYVNGVAQQSDKEAEKGLDDGDSNPPDDPDNPDEPPQEDGIRWLKGPWLLGPDGNVKSISAIRPVQLSGNVNDWSPPDLDTAILIEIGATTNVSITGIRRKKLQRRFLLLYNRSGFTVSLVNQSTASQVVHRFSWGTTGDAGETIGIPTGQMVALYYDAAQQAWKLFGIPAVGSDNLPPSIIPTPSPVPRFPPNYTWMAAAVTRGTTTGQRGIGEDNPSTTGTPTVIHEAEGIGLSMATGAVAGNAGGMGANSSTPSTVRVQHIPDWITILRAPSSLSNIRIWVVLSDTTPGNSDNLSGDGVGFRYSTVAGDGGWVGYTRNTGSGNATVSATVASISASGLYKLRVRVASSTSVFFSVNGSAEVQITTNLPTDTTSMQWYAYVITTEAVSKNIQWFRHSLRYAGSAYVSDEN